MFGKKDDPLVGVIRGIVNDTARKNEIENRVNEIFGIQSRKALPHEHIAEYDEVLSKAQEEMLNEKYSAREYAIAKDEREQDEKGGMKTAKEWEKYWRGGDKRMADFSEKARKKLKESHAESRINLDEISKITARKALSASEDPEYENVKDSKRNGPLAYDLKQRIKNKWGTKELRKAEFKSDLDNYGKVAKMWARKKIKESRAERRINRDSYENKITGSDTEELKKLKAKKARWEKLWGPVKKPGDNKK